MSGQHQVKIVSFSGIDGAGKTTQISAFQSWLEQMGHGTKLLTFWDNVVVLSSFREFLSLKAFKGDKGVGTPEKPLVRRDKNVTSGPVLFLRFFLYAADAIKLGFMVRSLRKGNTDVIIFDRYIYDELANLPMQNGFVRRFIRAVTAFTPTPDVAYLVDADPEVAFARKPEYPLEFVRSNREAYLNLSGLTGLISVIEPLSVDAAASRIRQIFVSQVPVADADLASIPAQ